MQIWNSLAEVPADLGRTVVAIGNFDGVHAGHQEVLGRMVAKAMAFTADGELTLAVAITFHPHPLQVLHPKRGVELVCGNADKLEFLEQAGLDAVLNLEFTRELAKQTPEEFVRLTLVKALHARTVVVGKDIRFGYQNSGDLDTMRQLGGQWGFDVKVLKDVHGEVGGKQARRRWSSSWVRELLLAGEVDSAAAILTRLHRMRGTVVHGDHRGRELGFPTANLAPESDGMVPEDGVYAGWLTPLSGSEQGHRMPAAISVGTNPTFDGTQRRVESYVLDRTDLELYGVQVVVEFVKRLRPTLRFDGLEPLITQMEQDVAQARELLQLSAHEDHAQQA